MTEKKFVSIAEAARLLQVARGTVYAWIKNGTLTEHKTPTGHRTLISVADIEKVLNQDS